MSRSTCYISPEARRVLILLNRQAGSGARGARVEELQRRLVRAGLQVDLCGDLDALSAAVAETNSLPLRAVVAAGGDGTVSAAVNRLASDVPLTVLPLGTENLLAKYLAFPFCVQELSEAILHGTTLAVDAGVANERLFLLMASCGFDADVVQRLHATRRGHIRHGSYLKPILASLRRYAYPELRVSCDADGAAECLTAARPHHAARWVFVVNIPRYAGGLRFVPGAVGTDGWLDLCTFRRGSMWHGLRYLAGVVCGRHRRWEDFSHVPVQRLRVEASEPVPYQLDGDPGGMLPVDISVAPGRVRLIVTESWALQHGCVHAVPASNESSRSRKLS